MALVSTRSMLKKAQQGGYAVGAFNVENMEIVQAVIAAAQEMNAPVMIQTTPGTVRYAGLDLYYAMVSALAQKAEIPVALHLDHGESFEMARDAARTGYTSVMIDGSKLDFEDNIALTCRVVEAVGDTPVEAELGTVGGKEDDTVAHSVAYTDPDKAGEFAQRTGISSLAVAIGTAHGIYKGTPHLDVELLSRIREKVDIPLVLHGASGVPHDQVRECIRRGICKVNYATELRIAYSDGVKAYLNQKPQAFDPKSYGKAGRESVIALVKDRIALCGCQDKA